MRSLQVKTDKGPGRGRLSRPFLQERNQQWIEVKPTAIAGFVFLCLQEGPAAALLCRNSGRHHTVLTVLKKNRPALLNAQKQREVDPTVSPDS